MVALMNKLLHYQLNLSLRTHVETSVVVYHTQTHSNSKDPALPSTSETLCNQASQAEAFWMTGGLTLVAEPESERSFQVASSVGSGLGVLGGGVHLYMCHRQTIEGPEL